jgi:hypothetical protein
MIGDVTEELWKERLNEDMVSLEYITAYQELDEQEAVAYAL